MAQSSFIKRLRWPGIGLLLAASLSWYWYFYVEPSLIYMATRDKHMFAIEEGVIAFNTLRNRLPTNVEEMILAQVLPKVGKIYYCPLAHESLFPKSLPYQNAEYEFRFSSEDVTIMIPESIYAQKRMTTRFSWLLPARRIIKVDSGTTFSSTNSVLDLIERAKRE
jgi:hypothetical protein